MKFYKRYHYFFFPAIIVIIMWLVKAVEYYFEMDFKALGIYPRNTQSLSGILTSPFIHADFNHLISNSTPLFVLSTAIFYFYRGHAFRIVLILWLLTGGSVWLGGRYSWHIGASGLVYAFSSFLFFSGILSKDRRFIAISLLIIFLYGSLVWGVFPTNGNISWESHLFGFCLGFIIAYFYGKDYISNEPQLKTTEIEDYVDINITYEKEYKIKYHYNDETSL